MQLLTGLFALRVVGQFLVAYSNIGLLPPMDHWQSGLLPYPLLLASQIALLALMMKINYDSASASGLFCTPRPRWSRRLTWIAIFYASSMVLRYLITMYIHPEMRWWGDTIPIFFHFVLAGYLFVIGRYHARQSTFARAPTAC